jgi:hypothetical protein
MLLGWPTSCKFMSVKALCIEWIAGKVSVKSPIAPLRITVILRNVTVSVG